MRDRGRTVTSANGEQSELRENERASGETPRGGGIGELSFLFSLLALASPFACGSCETSRDSPKLRKLGNR